MVEEIKMTLKNGIIFPKKLTANWLKEHIAGIDEVVKYKGAFTFRRGFYYRHGFTSEQLVEKLRSQLPDNIQIIDSGEIWKDFRGGAPLAKQSHWYVTIKIPG